MTGNHQFFVLGQNEFWSSEMTCCHVLLFVAFLPSSRLKRLVGRDSSGLLVIDEDSRFDSCQGCLGVIAPHSMQPTARLQKKMTAFRWF